MKKFFVPVLIIALAIFTISPAVSAQSEEREVDQNFAVNKISLDEETISKIDKYIVIQNNKFEITNVKELKKEITESEFQKVEQQLDDVNMMVEKNENIKKVNDDAFQVEMTDQEFEAKIEGYETNKFQLFAAKNGINKVKMHWWGAEVWLSRTTVTNIINGGVAGATVILGSLMPGIGHAALIALHGFLIGAFVDQKARAVKFNVNWVGKVSKFQYQ